MRGTYCHDRKANSGAGTEAPRGFGMFDRDVRPARPEPQVAADVPAAREVRVERQATINQRHHRTDVFAEIGERVGGIHQDVGIVAGYLQGPSRKIDALQTVSLRIFAPAVRNKPKTAECGPSECGPVPRIARDRLLH